MPSPSKPKLSYMGHKGRALAIRMAFAVGSIDYDYVPMTHTEVTEARSSGALPFGQVPVLEVDGKTMCQSGAILQWVADRASLTPEDPWERAKVVEFFGCLEDIVTALTPSFYATDDATKLQMRKALCEEDKLPLMFSRLEKMALDSSGAPGCLVGKKLSVAELVWTGLADWFTSGQLDGIPPAIINEKSHPTLMKARDTVLTHPKIKPVVDSLADEK